MKSLRLVLLAAAGLVALSLAEAAMAVYVPRVFVVHEAGSVEVTFRQTLADDPTAMFLFYVPSSYATIVGQAPGTTIGQVSAQVEARAVAPGAVLSLQGGTIVTDNPANHVSNTCAPGLHLAVWLLILPVPTQTEPLRIPVYVESTTSAPDASLGAVRLRACLPTPNVPESLGGARLGTKLLEAKLWLTNVRPQGGGEVRWAGRFTPYPPAGPAPNAAGTVEARALAGDPGAMTLRAARVTRAQRVRGKRIQRHFARLTGSVTQAGRGVANAPVRLIGSGKTRNVRTKSNGSFSLIVAVGRTATFSASTTVPDRDVTETGCAGATAPPCVSASSSGFQAASARARVTVPRAKPKR